MEMGWQSEWMNTWLWAARGFKLSRMSSNSTLMRTWENTTSASFASSLEIMRMSLMRPVIFSASFLILRAKSAFISSSTIMPLSKSSAYPCMEVMGVFSSWEALLKNSWRICFSFSIRFK